MQVDEARPFDRLVLQTRDPAFLMDPEDDRILDANDAGCELLGYTRAELLMTSVSQIHPAELQQLQEFLGDVKRHGTGSTIKLTCRTKSGVHLPTEITLYAFASGGRRYLLGLVLDRSEHRARAVWS